MRRLSLFTILRLIPFEPKLLPTIRHQTFKLLSLLKFRKQLFSDVETETIRDLHVIVKHAPFLLKDQLSILLDFLLFHLEDLSQKRVGTIVEIIGFIQRLVALESTTAQHYFDRVSSKCIDILETRNICFMQCVFAALTGLVQVTGYQLILLFRYDFFKLGFEVLQRPISFDIKAEVMKFLGCLGAFDLRFIRKINKLRESAKINKSTSKKHIILHFKKMNSRKLLFESSIRKTKKHPEQGLFELYQTFIQDVSLAETRAQSLLENDRRVHAHSDSTRKSPVSGGWTPKKFKISALREGTLMSDISSFESLLQYSATLMFDQLFDLLASKDFNYKVRVKILQALRHIVEYLGPLVHKFQDTLYPNLLNAFIGFQETGLKLGLLQILNVFVKNSGDGFSDNRENINYLLGLIQENLVHEPLQETLLDILKTLLKEFKRYLEHRFKSILLLLVKILFKTQSRRVNDSIFDILCNQLPRDHFDILLPKFCLFVQKNKPLMLKTEGILKYFETLVNKRNKCPGLAKYLNNIIRSILSLLDRLKADRPTPVSRSFFSFRTPVQSEYRPEQQALVDRSKPDKSSCC